MPEQQPIDALYIELALRTERLQQDTERAVQQLQRVLQDKLGNTADTLERRFISLGDVIGKSLLNAGVIALQTRNPLAAVTSLVQNLEVGFRAAAASGN